MNAKSGKKLLVMLGYCCASMVLAGSLNASEPSPESTNLPDSLDKSLARVPEFGIFYNALKQADLLKIVEDLDSATVFIPTDSALESEGSAFLLNSVLLAEENHSRLVSTLAQHIVQSDISDLMGTSNTFEVAALSGACVTISHSVDAIGGTKNTVEANHATVLDQVQFGKVTVYVVNHLLYQSYQDKRICHPTS